MQVLPCFLSLNYIELYFWFGMEEIKGYQDFLFSEFNSEITLEVYSTVDL